MKKRSIFNALVCVAFSLLILQRLHFESWELLIVSIGLSAALISYYETLKDNKNEPKTPQQ